MKTLKYFVLFCAFVCFTACSSDDNSSKIAQNYFTYKGKTYDLKAGIIEKDGTDWSDDGSMEYYITLATTKINVNSSNEIYPTERIFSLIDFKIFSKNSDHPNTGSYNYNDEYSIDFTFDNGGIGLDVNWEDDDDIDEVYLDITSGNIELHKSGSTYKMDLDFRTEDDEVVKGHYEGDLILYEYEDEYPRPAPNNILKAKRK